MTRHECTPNQLAMLSIYSAELSIPEQIRKLWKLGISAGHVVYEWNSDDEQPPLYIGETGNPIKRLRQHAADKGWARTADRVDIYVFCCIRQAKIIEARMIHMREPRHNKAHNFGNPHTSLPLERLGAYPVDGCEMCEPHTLTRRRPFNG